jgi:multiple RNA-binding domain-containing protein 1
MSRICVKNLAKGTAEKDLRIHFSAKGEITDVRIAKTKDGKSRLFGFVGFRTAEQAIESQKYFHNTFLQSSRIQVEMAIKIGDPSLSTGVAGRQKNKKELGDRKNASVSVNDRDSVQDRKSTKDEYVERAKQSSDKDTSRKPVIQNNNDKEQFLAVMKSRSQGQFWGNDDSVRGKNDINNGIDTSRRPVLQDSENSDSDDDSNPEVADIADSSDENSSEDENPRSGSSKSVVTGAVSDLDYLRSKIKPSSSAAVIKSDSSSSDSESDCSDEPSVLNKKTKVNLNDKKDVRTNGKHVGNQAGKLPSSDDKMGDAADSESVDNIAANGDDPANEVDESRLFVRNLPFSCSEEELTALFKEFGPITQTHLPLADSGDGRGKGYGFVQFMIPEHASRALTALDGTSFQGRLLHIIPAKRGIESTEKTQIPSVQGPKLSSYQQMKEEKRKKLANLKEGWNASHIRSDTVIDATAERYCTSCSNNI